MAYKVGDEVEFVVKKIESYGVFGNTAEGDNVFVHIKYVREGYIKDINRFFRLGDKVVGVLDTIQEDQKLFVSVLDYPLPDYEANKYSELEVLYEYLSKLVGEVSDPAKRKFEELAENYGVARIGLELGKKSEFKPDLGLMLAKRIEEDIRGYL